MLCCCTEKPFQFIPAKWKIIYNKNEILALDIMIWLCCWVEENQIFIYTTTWYHSFLYLVHRHNYTMHRYRRQPFIMAKWNTIQNASSKHKTILSITLKKNTHMHRLKSVYFKFLADSQTSWYVRMANVYFIYVVCCIAYVTYKMFCGQFGMIK